LSQPIAAVLGEKAVLDSTVHATHNKGLFAARCSIARAQLWQRKSLQLQGLSASGILRFRTISALPRFAPSPIRTV